jgi:hypothetical protein
MHEAIRTTTENAIQQGMWQFIPCGELLWLWQFLQCRNTHPYPNASKFIDYRLYDGERDHR